MMVIVAASHFFLWISQALLTRGAAVDSQHNKQYTPVVIAAEKHQWRAVKVSFTHKTELVVTMSGGSLSFYIIILKHKDHSDTVCRICLIGATCLGGYR